MNLKREFVVVFHPYVKPGKKRPFRYRAISINKLPDYIGQKRTDYIVAKMWEHGLDKEVFSVQGKGRVYMYRK